MLFFASSSYLKAQNSQYTINAQNQNSIVVSKLVLKSFQDIKSTNIAKKRIAIARLGGLKVKEAVPELIKLAEAKTTSSQIMRLVLGALGNIKDVRAIPILHNNLNNVNDEISKISIHSLILFQEEGLSFQISELLVSQRVMHKLEVLKALAKSKYWISYIENNEELFKLILISTNDSNEEIRSRAVALLGNIMKEKAQLKIESLLIHDLSDEVKIQSARSIVNFHRSKYIAVLKNVYGSDNIVLNCVISGSLVKLGDANSIHVLRSFLTSKEVKIRMEAIRQLSEIRTEEALKILESHKVNEKDISLQRMLEAIINI